MDILFRCDKQTLRRADNNTVASDSIGFLRAVFAFDDEWEGFGKSAIFTRGENSYQVLLDENNSAFVAHEVLTEAGWFEVGVVGAGDNGNVRATANRVSVEVVDGGPVSGSESLEPTPDVLEQLTAKVNTAIAATVGNLDLRGYGIVPAQTVTDFESMVFGTLLVRYFLWMGNNRNYNSASGLVYLRYGDVYSLSVANGGGFNVTNIGTLKGEQGTPGLPGEDGVDGIMYASATSEIDALPSSRTCYFLWMGEDKTLYGIVLLRRGEIYQVSGSGISRMVLPGANVCGSYPIYEKLADHTVTQEEADLETNTYTFETDMGGNGFLVDAITAYIEIPATDSVGTLEILLGYGNSYKAAYKRVNMISTSGTSIRCCLERRGYWTGWCLAGGARNENSQNGEYGAIAKNQITTPAKGIRVSATITFPAGTRIELYGVRNG